MNRNIKYIPLVATVLLLAPLFAGCQPNPTTPPVVYKGGLEEKIRDRKPAPSATAGLSSAPGTAATTETPVPQRLKNSFQNGKLTVNLDAEIVLPAAAKLPVVKAEPRKFTQAEADSIIKVLFQGKPAYKPKEIMTKDELNKQIIQMKALKVQMKGTDKEKAVNAKMDSAIAYFEEQLKTAPDKVDPVLSDGKYHTDEMGGQDVNVTTNLGKDYDANLFIYNSKSARSCSVWFTHESQGESYMGNETKLTGLPRNVTMPLEQARALAQKTVSDMGSDLMLAWTGMGTCRSNNMDGSVDPNMPQAYLFAFTREVNGVPSVYETDIGGNIPQEEIARADTTKE